MTYTFVQVLFQEHVARMLDEITDMRVELPGEKAVDLELWDYWV